VKRQRGAWPGAAIGAPPLTLRKLLARDDAHVHTFDAAAFLHEPALLPLLGKFNALDHGVGEALLECDPMARVKRDELAWQLFTTLMHRWPELPVALYNDRFELGNLFGHRAAARRVVTVGGRRRRPASLVEAGARAGRTAMWNGRPTWWSRTCWPTSGR